MNYKQLKDQLTELIILDENQRFLMHNIIQELLTSNGYFPSVREITKCFTYKDIINVLEKWKLMSPHDLSGITEVYKYGGSSNEEVNHLLNLYKNSPKSKFPCNCIFQNNELSLLAPNQDNPYSTNYRIIEYLCNELGNRWIDLGYHLSGMTSLTRDLQSQKDKRQKDKISELLQEYFGSHIDTFCCSLLSALESCQLNRQKDYIVNNILNAAL